MKIALVKPDNVGKYSCVVKNRLCEDSASGYVTIAGVCVCVRERD